jgi:hypothetical protein
VKYTIKQLGFILYNNRSVDGVVKNFLDRNIDPKKLIELEKKFDWCKSLYDDLEKFVEVDTSLLDIEKEDEILTPRQLEEIGETILNNVGNFSKDELSFLKNRGIDCNILSKYDVLGLSNFKSYEMLRRIGATCHPILSNFLKDGIEKGGIVFPLFESEKLINCAIRRISDVGKLKYTLAVPDTPVWGLNDLDKGEEIWICEGLFDMISLREIGLKSVSPSSAMWSGIQLYKLLEKSPKSVNIFCDNDRVGLKTGLVLNKFFNLMYIESKTYHSKYCKDASEHIFEKKLTVQDFEELKITKKMIENNNDNSFDFLSYLQKRKF